MCIRDRSAELERLGATEVLVVGGAAAVPPSVLDDLQITLGLDVDRVAGSDRYDTSRAVAARMNQDAQWWYDEALVVRGDEFADALSVAPYAYAWSAPVMLTRRDSLSTAAASALGANDIKTATIVGGTAALSDRVLASVSTICEANGGSEAERVSGSDRYATAAAVAQSAMDRGLGGSGLIGFATGTDFPDALGGGAACGARGGLLLLTAPNALSTSAKSLLDAEQYRVNDALVFGGTAAVSAACKEQIDAAVW
jgi:putative cell wall-binding protein